MTTKKRGPSVRSVSSHGESGSEGGHRSTPYGAARFLVSFLNVEPASLAGPERKLRSAMRELCDHVLEAAGAPGEDRRFGLHRLEDDPMNVLWAWYEEHPCTLTLMGWDCVVSAPPQPVYRPVEQANNSERQGSLAAFALWLLLLLADRQAYRAGRGFVFHSTTGHRMRLLKCSARCSRPYFVRWLGRGVADDAACPRCDPRHRPGARSDEYRRAKVRRRVNWLARQWKEKKWKTFGTVHSESGPLDRVRLDGFVSPTGELTVHIIGGICEEERSIYAEAVREFVTSLTGKRAIPALLKKL